MDNVVEIELCEPSPFLFGENGHLGVTDGTSVWIVVVTREAMIATADPPEASLKRLVRYADVYRDMAEVMLARGDGDDGKVWIFEKDVLALRAKQRPRDFNGRRKLSSLSIGAHR
ncbi:hypothetical protein [Neorhizobium sp. T25_27]|uniref:hypothetical protein n=1 Tax=Neorhizobium sp. T25_27 TaxID=2093831 RepID=UPI000CF9E03C|nr:hypothetical protein [Neorhizobium sp. T25_27]